jgi:hypothetical protein
MKGEELKGEKLSAALMLAHLISGSLPSGCPAGFRLPIPAPAFKSTQYGRWAILLAIVRGAKKLTGWNVRKVVGLLVG